MYLNGFSSSLPWQIQIEALRHIPALRDVHAFRPGYAIEYDFFDPTQLYHTLESKVVKNLFLAGQVNGTTGYEEAAGQGLIAGINAHQRVTGGEPFTLARNEAYIGVLIDDLVTRGVDEPYRMFTSRAEHRILLRQDDADMRLTEKGYRLGLATRERYDLMLAKREQIEALTTFCREFTVKAAVINPTLEALGMNALTPGTTPARPAAASPTQYGHPGTGTTRIAGSDRPTRGGPPPGNRRSRRNRHQVSRLHRARDPRLPSALHDSTMSPSRANSTTLRYTRYLPRHARNCKPSTPRQWGRLHASQACRQAILIFCSYYSADDLFHVKQLTSNLLIYNE